MAVGFQAFPRRTEENLQAKTDQLGGLSICGTEKNENYRKKYYFPFFHSLPTDGFFPENLTTCENKRKERPWTSLGKKRFIKCPSQCQRLVMITSAFAIPITLDQ